MARCQRGAIKAGFFSIQNLEVILFFLGGGAKHAKNLREFGSLDEFGRLFSGFVFYRK